MNLVPLALQRQYPNVSRQSWWNNWQLHRHYQFCIVFENTKAPGYVSEKLLLAFFVGCLSIYWGSSEILNMFSPESFVYWRDDEDQTVLLEILYLASNATAYGERLRAPILRHGQETVRQFFSLSSNVTDGYLQQNIRSMMGLPPF